MGLCEVKTACNETLREARLLSISDISELVPAKEKSPDGDPGEDESH
jgi:hypothetical protein